MDSKKSVAIIGSGPAGCMCAYFASKNFDVVLFDFAEPLKTLLYTGGGRCNLAYAEYDFKELAGFYPRGEKFLYSVFSQFSTTDTIEFFRSISVDTYIQDDSRIFPVSNSAKDVRGKFLIALKECKFKKEKVIGILNKEAKFFVKTQNNLYPFDKVVIATGGHAGFDLAKKMGHKVVEPKPALTGLITKEDLKPLQGVSLKQVNAEVFYQTKKLPPIKDDMIFTHEGISGPLAYKISSICARENYNKENPLLLKLNFLDIGIDLQQILNDNSKKNVKNIISEFVPKSFAEDICKKLHLSQKCYEIDGKTRDLILKELKEFEINIISPAREGEVVTSGGVFLDEINPKTMESRITKDLYFCGEVINVDGFCGGFNLQNCWSTGFIAGNSI